MAKKGIHPEYRETLFICGCGATHKINSTLKQDMHVDICSECHPFNTGKKREVDTAGRIERFRRRAAEKV